VADDDDRGTHRRAVAASVLRTATTTTGVVVVYYAAPLDRPPALAAVLTFGLGLLVLAALACWQVRRVLASDAPRLHAVEAAATGLPLLVVLFAAAYVLIAHDRPGSFSEALSHTDALYFTVTVFTTVGFGDITPVTELARILTTVQMVTGVLAVGLVAKVLFGAVQVAVLRREQESQDAVRAPDPPE
jgi:voltage-gated potassium channel